MPTTLTEDQQTKVIAVLLRKYPKDTLIEWLISCHYGNLDLLLEELANTHG